jgi:hypothetical protein
MTRRYLSRAHRSRHGVPARPTPFELWRDHVQAEEDDDRREALIDAGQDAGFCDARGRIIDPDSTPKERGHAEVNEAIRAAHAGRPEAVARRLGLRS